VSNKFLIYTSLVLSTIQSNAQDDDAEVYIELPTFEVIGSHLDIDTAALPIATITTEELSFWNDQTPAQAIRNQPYSFGSSNTENESNGGSGSAGANIHGLGNLSTLTLINGRRAGGNSALGFQHGGFADLNLIPNAAIKEIQVIADGASVAYGSDAVAGVVDIRLWDLFTGNQVDASYSDTTDGDASEKIFSFISGQQLNEKTHLVLLGSYYQKNAIYARDRNISEDTDRRPQGGQNQGSLTFPGRINYDGTEYILKDGVTTPTSLAGDYRVFDFSEDRYNFSEDANAIPEVERKSFMATLTHSINENVDIWGEFLYTDSEFNNGLAPAPWSGSAFSPAILTASRISPHLPAGIAPADLNQVNYRSFELGPFEIDQEKEALRSLIGFKGTFSDWDWETAIIYIETDLNDHFFGIADASAVATAIEDGDFNPFAAAFATGPGFDNEKVLKSAERNPVNRYDESLIGYDFKVDGTLFEVPAGDLEIAAGAEVRQEEIDIKIDPLFQAGNNLGAAQGNSFGAKRSVLAFFAESKIPLLKHKSQKLSIALSARYDYYWDKAVANPSAEDNQFNALVYRASLFYEPHESLKLYASYGTSYRAPTLTESYAAGQFSAYIYNDPIGPTPDSSRVFTLIAGNDDLDPEKSENFNFGINFEPEPNQGLRAGINFYHIKREDVIVNSGQDVINRDAGGVIRDAFGNLSLVFANWFNAAAVETNGIDYDISYTQPTQRGYWQAQLGVNQVLNYNIQAISGESSVSYLGRLVDPRASNENIAGPGSIPEFKGYARFTWSHDALTLGATLNYIDSLNDNPAFTTFNNKRRIDSWTSLDLSASYVWYDTAPTLIKNTTLNIGIENVTDEAPPYAAGAFADGYDASLYSLEGRRIFVSVSRRF